VFRSFRSNKRRKKIHKDQRHLEARARRLLESYLGADDRQKKKYYEVIAGAAAASQPAAFEPSLEDAELARSSAKAALKVVKSRERQAIDENDPLAALITDAYATVAIAYHRAAGVYTLDEKMQRLGTAAVHLVTIANSYMAAQKRAQ
jgi:hypothetical protein